MERNIKPRKKKVQEEEAVMNVGITKENEGNEGKMKGGNGSGPRLRAPLSSPSST